MSPPRAWWGAAPLLTVPLALGALTLFPPTSSQGNPSTYLLALRDLAVQDRLFPLVAIAAVVTSLFVTRSAVRCVRDSRASAALALLPLLLVSLVIQAAIIHGLGSITKVIAPHSTARAIASLSGASELTLYRMLGQLTAAAGALCVAPALVSKHRLTRVGLVASMIALAAGFFAAAFGTHVARTTGFAVASSRPGEELELMLPAIAQWREVMFVSNSLMSCAVLLGVGAAIGLGLRGEALPGVLHVMGLTIFGVGVRGATAFEERWTHHLLLESNAFEGGVRVASDAPALSGYARLGGHLTALLDQVDSASEGVALPVGLVVEAKETPSALALALAQLRIRHIHRAILVVPAEPVPVPAAFLPSMRFRSRFHVWVPLAVQADDEPRCRGRATRNGVQLEVRFEGEPLQVWLAPASTVVFERAPAPCVALDSLAGLQGVELARAARTALAHGYRLEVSPPTSPAPRDVVAPERIKL